MEPQRIAQLRVISLFESMTDAELTTIAESCSIRTYERNRQIMDERESTTDVFFVLDGTVRVNAYTAGGREVILSEVGAGELFGEFAAVDGLPRSATVMALSDCVLARMPAASFLDLVQRDARIASRLVKLLVTKVRRMTERVVEVSALAVRERVRRELLRLSPDGTALQQGSVIRPAPTHYEIAARIGSHREAVTREFNRLEAEKIIEVRRREIRIVDIDRLRGADDL